MLEGKAGELLRCFCPGSLAGDSSIPRAGLCLPPGWAFPGFSSLHCPVVFTGSKAASCFLAVTIPSSSLTPFISRSRRRLVGEVPLGIQISRKGK